MSRETLGYFFVFFTGAGLGLYVAYVVYLHTRVELLRRLMEEMPHHFENPWRAISIAFYGDQP